MRRFSVKEHRSLLDTGILEEDEPVELLEGYLVYKMAHNPPHDATVRIVPRNSIDCGLQDLMFAFKVRLRRQTANQSQTQPSSEEMSEVTPLAIRGLTT